MFAALLGTIVSATTCCAASPVPTDQDLSALMLSLDAVLAEAQPNVINTAGWAMLSDARQNLRSVMAQSPATLRLIPTSHRNLIQSLEEITTAIQLLHSQNSLSPGLTAALDRASAATTSVFASQVYYGFELPEETGPIDLRASLVRVGGHIANSLFPWPLVALVILAWISWSKTAERIIRRMGKVTAFGTTFEFTQEGTIELGKQTNATFREFRNYVNQTFAKLASQFDIERMVTALVSEHVDPYCQNYTPPKTPDPSLAVSSLPPAVGKRAEQLEGFRCTIHVPDILFREDLYQLLSYYPKSSGPPGRVWSMRYGIIGHAYRSKQSQYAADVKSDNITALIIKWGMTRQEAEVALQSPPCVGAVVLNDRAGPVGIFFFDTKIVGGFGSHEERDPFTKGLIAKIQEASEAVGLIEALKKLNAEAAKFNPTIKVSD